MHPCTAAAQTPCCAHSHLLQVRQLVQQWRQAYSQLRFEHQRQRDELVHLGMHERLSEDNEKLLRRENGALKQALAELADAAVRLKRLRAEHEALREDLDDARASLYAGSLEHEARQAELRRQLDAEGRGRREAQRKLDAEAAACASLREEVEARGAENALLAAELKECRERLEAKEQEYRCQLIATKLERDEQVARLEGRLQRLQTSGHDACRQQCAALQQELERARTELARRQGDPLPAEEQPGVASPSPPWQRTTAAKDSNAGSAESPAQERAGNSAKQKTWPEDFGRFWREDAKEATVRAYGTARGPGRQSVEAAPGNASEGRRAGVPASSLIGPEKISIRAVRAGDNREPVSDETVDSTHRAQSARDLVAVGDPERIAAAASSAETCGGPNAARTPLRVSDIIKKSAGRRGEPTPAKDGAARRPTVDVGADVVVSDSDRDHEDECRDEGPGSDLVVMVPATPPTPSKQQKRRRLCIEVDEMLFVDA
ncbi:ribonuclease Y [Dermacentor silvarum]|uniref:ribonuclease Y n=1 Tax=Dermacentor silvarum TaxID=543639 RepID=UPI0021008FFD|nr:ribonuclease Y [Dermacentor silvarum]